jgi:hypothetical protein
MRNGYQPKASPRKEQLQPPNQGSAAREPKGRLSEPCASILAIRAVSRLYRNHPPQLVSPILDELADALEGVSREQKTKTGEDRGIV